MTTREDCEKWLRENFDDLNIPEIVTVLHEFSKTTVGHFVVDQSFRAEEERQKASADLRDTTIDLRWAQDWKNFTGR